MLTRAALKWTFLVAPLALTFPLAHADPVRVTEQVTVIVDGDTVILGNGDKIRYVGVDTPERDEPLYDEATAYNRKMVFGKNVSIWSCTARPYDKHARRLATLKMGNLDVSVEMVRAGLGRVFTDSSCMDDEKIEESWKAALEALKARRGIWKDIGDAPASADDANTLIEKNGWVRGTVRSVHVGEKATHVNFGANWRNDFTATVFKEDRARFESAGVALDNSLVGKTLTVFGHVTKRNGPNMILQSPVQILPTDPN